MRCSGFANRLSLVGGRHYVARLALLTTCVTGILLRPLGWAPAAHAYCAYLTNGRSGTVSVIDTALNAVVATVDVGLWPAGIAVAPDGRSAYVANSQGRSTAAPGDASVIGTETNRVVATIPVGSNPDGMAISSLPMCVDGHPTCVGDCGVDRQVTVDEIITLANVALGNEQLSDCQAGDANGDGQITVDEILTAVNNALNGCE